LPERLPYSEKVGVIRPISRDNSDVNEDAAANHNKGVESPELKPRPFTTAATAVNNRVNNNNSNNSKEMIVIEKAATAVSVPIESWLKNTQVSIFFLIFGSGFRDEKCSYPE
jgi:hypothetical protein